MSYIIRMIKDEYIKPVLRSQQTARQLKKTIKNLKAELKPNTDKVSGNDVIDTDSGVNLQIIANDKEFQAFLKDFRKQWKQFCDEYLLSLSAVDAYKRTYPKTSYNACKSNGHRLLQNEQVQTYINYVHKKRIDRFNISKNGILLHLIDIVECGKPLLKANKPSMPVVKALELISRITGDIAPANSNNQSSDLTIIKCYVVPALGHAMVIPEPTLEMARRAAEEALKK